MCGASHADVADIYSSFLIYCYGIRIGVDRLQMLLSFFWYLWKMPDCITASISLLYVWDLNLAEYVAMTKGIVRGCERNLGKEVAAWEKS